MLYCCYTFQKICQILHQNNKFEVSIRRWNYTYLQRRQNVMYTFISIGYLACVHFDNQPFNSSFLAVPNLFETRTRNATCMHRSWLQRFPLLSACGWSISFHRLWLAWLYSSQKSRWMPLIHGSASMTFGTGNKASSEDRQFHQILSKVWKIVTYIQGV